MGGRAGAEAASHAAIVGRADGMRHELDFRNVKKVTDEAETNGLNDADNWVLSGGNRSWEVPTADSASWEQA